MNPTQAAQYLQALALDVAVLRARALNALDHLERCRGGYPSTASGADMGGGGGGGRTLVIDGEAIPVTGTEAAVLAPPNDPAADALARVRRELPRIQRDVAALAKLVTAWTPEELLPGRWHDAAENLEDDLWCPNHRVHGVYEVKAEKRKHCRWCDDVKRDTEFLPDGELIRRRNQVHRLTSADYDAFKRRVKGRAK